MKETVRKSAIATQVALSKIVDEYNLPREEVYKKFTEVYLEVLESDEEDTL